MAIALYSQVSETLSQRIAAGVYPLGSTMPTENVLAEEFAVSRQTVRAALRQLQDGGVITRRRGSGTVVTAQRPKGSYSQSVSSLEDLVQFAAQAPRTLLKVQEVVVDTVLAPQLGVQPGTRWIQFSSTRGDLDKDPMAWTDVYVDAHYKGLKRLVQDHPDRLISELMEAHYGRRIASIAQTIAACELPASVARALNASVHSAGLLVLRQYRDQAGAIVESSVSYHPAGRYAFSMTLIRQT